MKKWFFTGWSKTFRCKAREITRHEAYFSWYAAAMTKDERNGSSWVFFNSLPGGNLRCGLKTRKLSAGSRTGVHVKKVIDGKSEQGADLEHFFRSL